MKLTSRSEGIVVFSAKGSRLIIKSTEVRLSHISLLPLEEFSAMKKKRKMMREIKPTGIKDKNGKEICEGDILDVTSSYTAVDFWGRPIPLSPDFEQLVLATIPEIYLLGTVNEISKFAEVIGNIYENPELWEGVKR